MTLDELRGRLETWKREHAICLAGCHVVQDCRVLLAALDVVEASRRWLDAQSSMDGSRPSWISQQLRAAIDACDATNEAVDTFDAALRDEAGDRT